MKPTVLIVDDKPNFLSLIGKVLARDVRVVTARGVQEAIAALAPPTTPDAVVCDLRMPDGDGVEVLRALRASGSAAPFILMTAYATVATAVQAMREGAYDYLTKPFDPDELRALVLRALVQSAASPQVERSSAPQLSNVVATEQPAHATARVAAGHEGARGSVASPVEAPSERSATARPLTEMTYREVVDTARDGATRLYLEALLAKHRGNVTNAAAHAGLERESFHRLLRRHDLRAEAFRDAPVSPSSGAPGPEDDDDDHED